MYFMDYRDDEPMETIVIAGGKSGIMVLDDYQIELLGEAHITIAMDRCTGYITAYKITVTPPSNSLMGI